MSFSPAIFNALAQTIEECDSGSIVFGTGAGLVWDSAAVYTHTIFSYGLYVHKFEEVQKFHWQWVYNIE